MQGVAFCRPCDEGIRAKLATADEKEINRRKEGRSKYLLDCSVSSPHHQEYADCCPTDMFLLSWQQSTDKQSARLQLTAEVRYQENAAAVLLCRKGTNVSAAVWGIRSAAAVTTAAALGLGSKTVMIAPCHLVTTLIAVTHQHQHHLHHQHQHHYYRQQSKNWF